jgi:MFS family permease
MADPFDMATTMTDCWITSNNAQFEPTTGSKEGDINQLPPHDLNQSSTGRSIQGTRWFLVCLAIFSCNLLYGLDNTIVADIQAAVIDTFGDVPKLGWLGFGFPLGSIAVILPMCVKSSSWQKGNLSHETVWADRFPRGKSYAMFDTKWLYFFSLTMFAAGSALCGGAPSMDALIIGRVWAGAGGAGMYLG